MCRSRGGEGSNLFSYKIYKIIEINIFMNPKIILTDNHKGLLTTYISFIEVFVTLSIMLVGINDL